MYLLDTNIILEFLLDQEKADGVGQFLRNIPLETVHLSEFALYSMGIILLHRGKADTFSQTIDDLLLSGGIRLVRLGLWDMPDLVQVAQEFDLDFDDAYQYVVAEKYDLTVVSFDKDFDRTERGRRTPSEILQELSENIPDRTIPTR